MIQPEYWPSNKQNRLNTLFYDSLKQKYGIKDYYSGKKILKAKYDEIVLNVTENKMNKVRIGTKWGLLDREGVLKTPLIYDQIKGEFYYSYLEFGLEINPESYPGYYAGNQYLYGVQNKRMTILDRNGQTITDTTFTAVNPMEERTSYNGVTQRYFIVQDHNRWGVISNNGQLIIPLIYQEIQHIRCTHDLLKVSTGNKYGLLSLQGDTLIPIEYESLNLLKSTWVGQTASKITLFSCTGQKSEIHDINEVSPHGKSIGEQYQNPFLLGKKNNKYGLIDYAQQWVLPPRYDEITYKDRYYIMRIGKKIGYYHFKPHLTLPVIYDEISRPNYYYIFVKKDGKMGAFNRKGEMVLPIEYDTIHPLIVDGYNHTLVGAKNQHWEITTTIGYQLTDNSFDSVYSVSSSSFIVQRKESFYIGSSYLDTLLIDWSTPFEELKYLTKTNFGQVLKYKKSNQFGLLLIRTSDYKYLTDTTFDEFIDVFDYESSYLFKKNGRYCLISNRGKYLAPLKYKKYKLELGQRKINYIYLKDDNDWYRVSYYGNIRKLPADHYLNKE